MGCSKIQISFHKFTVLRSFWKNETPTFPPTWNQLIHPLIFRWGWWFVLKKHLHSTLEIARGGEPTIQVKNQCRILNVCSSPPTVSPRVSPNYGCWNPAKGLFLCKSFTSFQDIFLGRCPKNSSPKFSLQVPPFLQQLRVWCPVFSFFRTALRLPVG